MNCAGGGSSGGFPMLRKEVDWSISGKSKTLTAPALKIQMLAMAIIIICCILFSSIECSGLLGELSASYIAKLFARLSKLSNVCYQ